MPKQNGAVLTSVSLEVGGEGLLHKDIPVSFNRRESSGRVEICLCNADVTARFLAGPRTAGRCERGCYGFQVEHNNRFQLLGKTGQLFSENIVTVKVAKDQVRLEVA